MNRKKGRISSTISSLIALTLAVGIATAHAESVTINASNSGYYNLFGTPNGTKHNIAQWGDTYRDWLGFDLSGVNGVITSATLQVASDRQNASGQTIKW